MNPKFVSNKLRALQLGEKYTLPLQVLQIQGSTRFKSYFFKDYLYSGDSPKVIRLYFDDPIRGMDFLLNKLWYKAAAALPIYFGYGDRLVGALAVDGQELIDVLLPTTTLRPAKTLDTARFQILNGGPEGSLLDSFTDPLDDHTSLVLSASLLAERLDYLDAEGITTTQSADVPFLRLEHLFVEGNHPKPFFVQLDFSGNFKNAEKQRQTFAFVNQADSLGVQFMPRRPSSPGTTHMFLYYNGFDDPEQTVAIMDSLDAYNIRWDSGRWKSVVELRASLQDKRRYTETLIIINTISFVFFLTTISWLRLKLEFHTVGLLQSFGYTQRLINAVYLSGYLLLIGAGFLGGIALVFLLGLLPEARFSMAFLGESFAYFVAYPANYIVYYLAILVGVALLVVWSILRVLLRHEDIYGLIKYEH